MNAPGCTQLNPFLVDIASYQLTMLELFRQVSSKFGSKVLQLTRDLAETTAGLSAVTTAKNAHVASNQLSEGIAQFNSQQLAKTK